MKGLLHSKIFRQNLGKWLCMYVGAILLLTTVVTYSKYMMGVQGVDDAKPAKFNVDVVGLDEDNQVINDNVVSLGSKRRINAPLTFDIKINTEIEAMANLTAYLYIDPRFELVGVVKRNSDNTDNEEILCVNNCDITNSDNQYSLINMKLLNPAQITNYIYRVAVKYKLPESGRYDQEITSDVKIVQVLYNATQIINKNNNK